MEKIKLTTSEDYVDGRTEKPRTPEEVREEFKKRFMIVDDGYDYTSENPPEELPTVFHGTSAWFEEEIINSGVQNSLESIHSIQDVFDVHPDLGKLLKNELSRDETSIANRMKPDTNENRRRVYCAYYHDYSTSYTRGPEIIQDYLKIAKRNYGRWYSEEREPFQEFLNRIAEEIQPVDSMEKKLLLSCIKPEPLVVHAKCSREEFDPEETAKYHGQMPEATFMNSAEKRKELIEKVKWAQERYIRHIKGKIVNLEESNRMWQYIQTATNMTTSSEFELLSTSDLVQIYLRSSFTELLFRKINPESITKLERNSLS